VTGLQEAFYIVGLVYMSVSLVAILAILIIIGIIRHKVVSLEKIVKHRLEPAANVATGAAELINAIRSLTGRAK
jgi:hypothetical protein